jgi:hypothetical protein
MDAEGVARYKWVLGIIAVVIVVMIVLMLAGVDWFGMRSTNPKPTELVFWRKYDPLVPLRVTYKEVGPNTPFERYTMIVDMVWINTRMDGNDRRLYRHILHRGSGEGADFLQRSSPQIRNAGAEAGPTEAEILGRMPQGLPIRMNPGIFADPHTNDMLIFIDTERNNNAYRESIRIPDIPMDEPFRLALFVMPNMIEVYINCQLEVTKMIDGRPRKIEEGWYGFVGPKPLTAQIQNLRLLDDILTPKDLKAYCSKRPEFETTVTCNQAV